jgi:hypothetical protein
MALDYQPLTADSDFTIVLLAASVPRTETDQTDEPVGCTTRSTPP